MSAQLLNLSVLVSFSCYYNGTNPRTQVGDVLVSFSCYSSSENTERHSKIVLVSFSCYRMVETGSFVYAVF